MAKRVKKYLFVITSSQYKYMTNDIEFENVGEDWKTDNRYFEPGIVAKDEKEVVKILKKRFKYTTKIEVYQLKSKKEWKAK